MGTIPHPSYNDGSLLLSPASGSWENPLGGGDLGGRREREEVGQV